MSSDPHDPLPEDLTPASGPGAEELDLLRLVCAVAWCDGDFSADEQRLLGKLVARYLTPFDGAGPSSEAVQIIAARAAAPELLDTLAHALPSPEDRQLALKLAFIMVLVGRAPGDREAINPREKQTYRRLVEALALPNEEVEATEWAARRELQEHRGGWLDLLRQSIGGLGAWPDDTAAADPGVPRL
ncbi:MAG: hypothetical protein ACKOZW_09230 [Cyanobium sp.]